MRKVLLVLISSLMVFVVACSGNSEKNTENSESNIENIETEFEYEENVVGGIVILSQLNTLEFRSLLGGTPRVEVATVFILKKSWNEHSCFVVKGRYNNFIKYGNSVEVSYKVEYEYEISEEGRVRKLVETHGPRSVFFQYFTPRLNADESTSFVKHTTDCMIVSISNVKTWTN